MSHDPPIPEVPPPTHTPPGPEGAATDAAAVGAPRDFGDPVAEYSALRHAPPLGGRTTPTGGAIVVDRSYRSRGTFAGAKAREVLTGLVTNDVIALAEGEGCYAVALTPKGKILADLRIFASADDVFFDVPPRAAPGWWGMVRKYVNPRLARYSDASTTVAEVAVFGTRSHAVVASALGVPWEELAHMHLFAHRRIEALGTSVRLARVPDLGVEGFSLFVPAADRALVMDALVSRGAHRAGLDALEIARIEAGRPEWGIEMDENTLAQEANMEALHAISFTKGCYTGQETVARVHFRGHVNRHLRGLRYDEATVPARGAEVRDATGKSVGDVRSVVISPRLGGIAIAMLRREVEDGMDVEILVGATVIRASVVALPFPG